MTNEITNKIKSNGCIVIEDNVVGDINLNSTDKLVYGIIKALSNNKGYCFATNDYIGKRANLSKSTISAQVLSGVFEVIICDINLCLFSKIW